MATKTANRVFLYEDRLILGVVLANALRELLLNGNPTLGESGISTLQFTNRKGTGAGRDDTAVISPDVRFFDDGKGSVPYVMIVGIQQRAQREEWGDDQWLYPCMASLDCGANGSSPDSATPGQASGTADELLGAFVLNLVSSYEVMTAAGFTHPAARPEGPPGGATGKDGQPWEFSSPVTVEFDVYVSRT